MLSPAKLTCYRCREKRPDSEFNRNRARVDRRGRQGRCKRCERAYKAARKNGAPARYVPLTREQREQKLHARRAALDPGPLYDAEAIGLVKEEA